MKKNAMKLLVAGAFLVAGLMSYGAQSAHAQAEAPSYAGGIRFQNPSFIGLKECRIERSTPTATLVLCDSGTGLLYGIHTSSGPGGAGAFAIALDSGTPVNMNADTVGLKISPEVWASSSATIPNAGCTSSVPNAGGPCGIWEPKWPARYENGLVAERFNGLSNVILYYRPDTADNP